MTQPNSKMSKFMRYIILTPRPCLVYSKIQNFFKIPHHNGSYSTCMEH
jgi:hypothetical protein